MQLQGINHLCFSVANLEKSITFYEQVFDAKLLVVGRTLAYFDLNGLWIALNEERDISRVEIHESYTHLAFTISEDDFQGWLAKLIRLQVNLLPGRVREIEDKRSIYFTDWDGHKFELHTGKLQERIEHYQRTKGHMQFFN